jgi:hypothetical protein
MAVTTAPFAGGSTSGHPANDLIATVNEIWTDMVNEKTFNDTVLANFVTDLSSYAQDGGAVLFKKRWSTIKLAKCWNTLRAFSTLMVKI